MNRICVIDGQGGGIGSTIIKKISAFCSDNIEIVALGTNAIATAQMLKAGANRGASGENAIIQTLKTVDIIIGPIGIIMAHAMMGEVTPGIAEAVASSPARNFRWLLACLCHAFSSPSRLRILSASSSAYRELTGAVW